MKAQGDIWPRLAVVMWEKQAGGRQPPRVSSGLCRVTFLPPSPGFPLPCQVIQPFIASSLLCDPHTPTEQRLPGEEGRLLAFLSSGRLGPIVLKIWGL